MSAVDMVIMCLGYIAGVVTLIWWQLGGWLARQRAWSDYRVHKERIEVARDFLEYTNEPRFNALNTLLDKIK